MKNYLGGSLLLMLSGCPLMASAGAFGNGDFSSGFAGWSGVLDDLGTVSPSNIDPVTAPSFFQITGGLAELSLDANNSAIGLVELSQTFDLTNIGNSLAIQFDWDWFASDASLDTFEMELRDSTGRSFNFVDSLFGGPDYVSAAAPGQRNDSFSVAANYFANTSLTLRFAITDIDFDVRDFLTVGNIQVSESSSTIPASVPAPLALLGIGLLGLAGARHRAVR